MNVLTEIVRAVRCGNITASGRSCIPPAAIESAARALSVKKSTVAEKCSIIKSPIIGPTTIARFVERAKYPMPSPLRAGGRMSAVSAAAVVVDTAKMMPWSRRSP